MAPKRYESEKVDVSRLGEPLHFEFSGRTAPNRFMKAAMTERVCSWSPTNPKVRGVPSKDYINMYKRWGEGGFGVVLTGNIMFQCEHLEAAGNPIIPSEDPFEGERFDGFKELATQAKKHGSLIVAQVNHPGRQVAETIEKHPISASDVKLADIMGMTFGKPRAATQEDIAGIIEGFAHTAEYLDKAGFDGIQLHAAHGYLLAQFLSQTTNLRTDKYGGSLENRARIILEIADEIRKRVNPSFIVSIKLNSVEFQEKGFQPEEAVKLCGLLEENRFDFVELSGGTYESLAFEHKKESTKKREAFFVEFAEMITPGLKKTKCYITGGLKTAGAMVKALDVCHGIGLGRPAGQEFHLPKDILERKVEGAIEPNTDPGNMGLDLMITGALMRQVGKDHEPTDMSDEKNVAHFLTDMQAWMEKMQNDKENKEYGYLDITLPTVPYGTVPTQ